jgi:hypothetical protein
MNLEGPLVTVFFILSYFSPVLLRHFIFRPPYFAYQGLLSYFIQDLLFVFIHILLSHFTPDILRIIIRTSFFYLDSCACS